MDYISLIQNRKSARGFTNQQITDAQYKAIRGYYENGCKKLIPDIQTELILMDSNVIADMKMINAAGYESNLIGAPGYFIILTEDKEGGILNASYMAEDLVLKLLDMGLGSCFITFSDGDRIKEVLEIESEKQVAIIVAFGNEVRMAKQMRFNALTMAGIGLSEKRHYFDPKKKVDDMTYIDTWGSRYGLDEILGYYQDILGEALYAASLSPSYLNRQPYGFVLKGAEAVLVSTPDKYTDPVSKQQNLGIVLLHFAAAASQAMGQDTIWTLKDAGEGLDLPEGYEAIATISC